MCHNPKEIRLKTRLCLALSHLREHQFKNSFQDCLDPLCLCGERILKHIAISCLTVRPIHTKERPF